MCLFCLIVVKVAVLMLFSVLVFFAASPSTENQSDVDL